MTNSFLNKVSAQRRVLSVVNARTNGIRQLTGLSSAAIDLWRRKVGIDATKDVVEKLVVLGELCQCISDRSHETFQPLDSTLAKRVESELGTLRTLVADLGHGDV